MDCPEPRSRAEASGTWTESQALLSVTHPIRYTKAKIRNKTSLNELCFSNFLFLYEKCPPDKSIRQRGNFVRTYRKSYSYLCDRHPSCAVRLRISKSERRDRKAGLQGSTRRRIAAFDSRRAWIARLALLPSILLPSFPWIWRNISFPKPFCVPPYSAW
jgi:hypothetical protein